MTPQIKGSLSRGSVLLALLGILAPRAAHAGPGIARGTVLISAERLFGLSFNRTSSEDGANTTAVDHTDFSLFLSSPTTVHMLPRLAVDFAIIDGLTLGGSFGFSFGDQDTSTSNGNDSTSQDGPSTSALVIAPRVGYVLGLSHLLSLWLRGGLTYYRTNTETDGTTFTGTPRTISNRTSGLSLDVEPTLIVKPFDHFGFTAGFLINLPLAGTRTVETTVGNTTTSTSVDETIRNFGVVVGMLGSF